LLKSNDAKDPAFSQRMFDSGWREEVHADASKFIQFCEQHHLALDTDSILPFCRFVTPEFEAHKAGKGFDAQFFLCVEDSAQGVSSAVEDGCEVVDLQWLAPLEALVLFQRGEIFLPPPQYHILTEVQCTQTHAPICLHEPMIHSLLSACMHQ
jgi:hypothetical protein